MGADGAGFFGFFGNVPLYILLVVLHRICRGKGGEMSSPRVEDAWSGLRGRSILEEEGGKRGGDVDGADAVGFEFLLWICKSRTSIPDSEASS